MAQVINTNVLSLVTQNNLNRSQGVLGTAIERLSSGARINSAKDDAAGQAIANRFTANVKAWHRLPVTLTTVSLSHRLLKVLLTKSTTTSSVSVN